MILTSDKNDEMSDNTLYVFDGESEVGMGERVNIGECIPEKFLEKRGEEDFSGIFCVGAMRKLLYEKFEDVTSMRDVQQGLSEWMNWLEGG